MPKIFIITLLVFLMASVPYSNSFVKIDVSKASKNFATTDPSLPTTDDNEINATITPQTTTSKAIGITSTTTTTSAVVVDSKNQSISVTTSSTTSVPTTTTVVSIARNDTSNATTNRNMTEIMNDFPSLRGANKRLHTPSNYYCSCDLMTNLCDINCCCDIDCTDTMYESFECTEEHLTIHDFDWLSGLHSCKLKNDLLCVVGKSESSSASQEVIDMNLKESIKYKWPKIFATNENNDDDRETYRADDPILVFDENAEEIKTFTIPYSLTGDYCQVDQPIKYLGSEQSSCIRSNEQHESFINTYQAQLLNSKILASRRGIDNHAMMTEYCGSMTTTTNSLVDNHHHPNCIPIQVFDCIHSVAAAHCHPFNETEYQFEETFQNHKIIIDFVHNFTNVLNCSVFFVYTEMATRDMVRTIKVRFRQINETVNVHKLSGNIGYLLGKPLIASKYVPFNVTTTDQSDVILDYFHENQTVDHLLKLPSFRQNFCRLDNVTYETIVFGYDFFTKCDVQLDDQNIAITVDTNFTEICSTFQKGIFFYLLHGVELKVNRTSEIATLISEFGNPVNQSNHWIGFESNYGDMFDEPIVGHFDRDESETDFTCRNMVLNVKYEFVYGILSVGGVRHQRLIKGARIELGTRVDLKFRMGEEMRVPVFVDVMFFDLTSSAAVDLKWWSLLLVGVGIYNFL